MIPCTTICVGQQDAEILGADNRALQAAVEYIAALGGGIVEILEGVYTMHDSLHLRSNVTVRGQGEQTVLRKGEGKVYLLYLDGDYGEEQITVADGTGLQVGMGVAVNDDRSGGFHTAVGTILWQDGNAFGISVPLNADCMAHQNAKAATVFPVVSGYYVQNARVENLAVDGNKANNPWLNGCRGAGIFLYRGHGTVIEKCVIRDYHGDGISFQQSNDVVVTDCLAEGCTHLGFHPGSGSQRPTLRGNRAYRNGDMGIFLCWRVKHGVFEDNDVRENNRYGFSIGHKDTDNLLRRNTVVGNGIAGFHFRNESEPMAGHRNRIEENEIAGNGKYGIRVDGETHDLVIASNRFKENPVALSIGAKVSRVSLAENVGAEVVENEAGASVFV